MVYFGKKISILAATVRVFVVYEEVIVLLPVFFQGSQLVRKGLAAIQDVHSNRSSQSFIHRINRYGRASQPIQLVEARDVRQHGEAAKYKRIRRKLPPQAIQRLIDKGIDKIRGGFG